MKRQGCVYKIRSVFYTPPKEKVKISGSGDKKILVLKHHDLLGLFPFVVEAEFG